MRAILLLMLSGVLLSGCRSAQPSKAPAAAKGEPSAKKAAEQQSSRPTPARPSTPDAGRPINEPTGKVASVNPGLRFVVIDFGFSPAPQVDQRLNVYRQGQKVGEVKISSQARNSIIAADITAGEANVGDEVRP